MILCMEETKTTSSSVETVTIFWMEIKHMKHGLVTYQVMIPFVVVQAMIR